jgi:hypothetical protein
MLAGNQSEARMIAMTRQTAEEAAAGPDLSWKGLYKAGGISAFLYVILGIIVPAVLIFFNQYDFDMDGAEILKFIAATKNWFLIFQTLVLMPGILAVVVFAALFAALKHLDKGYAALGAVLAITMQILFVAYYPVLLGLVHLGGQYMAVEPARQIAFETAAEALLAQNNAFNPLYEGVFAVSILIISLVMLKGVFHKFVAYLGIATFVAAYVGLALWPLVGVAYFWWWFFFVIWFVAIGWKLYRLDSV